MLENDEFVQDFSHKTPSKAVTRQTEKKMVLKETVCEYGVDGNGGLWHRFFTLCYPRFRFSYIMIGVCVLAAVSWFYHTNFQNNTCIIAALTKCGNEENPCLPAHGGGTPPPWMT